MDVGPVGFEPTTNGLKGRCSTAELQAQPELISLPNFGFFADYGRFSGYTDFEDSAAQQVCWCEEGIACVYRLDFLFLRRQPVRLH